MLTDCIASNLNQLLVAFEGTNENYHIVCINCQAIVDSLGDRGGSAGDAGPEIGTLLGDGASDTGTLHLTLVVDDDSSIVCIANENLVFRFRNNKPSK